MILRNQSERTGSFELEGKLGGGGEDIDRFAVSGEEFDGGRRPNGEELGGAEGGGGA